MGHCKIKLIRHPSYSYLLKILLHILRHLKSTTESYVRFFLDSSFFQPITKVSWHVLTTQGFMTFLFENLIRRGRVIKCMVRREQEKKGTWWTYTFNWNASFYFHPSRKLARVFFSGGVLVEETANVEEMRERLINTQKSLRHT